MMPERICLAFTGASGLAYGLRLLEVLLQQGKTVDLLISPAAQVVAQQELGQRWPSQAQEANVYWQTYFGEVSGSVRVWGRDNWFSPVASGSNPADAMVICPCTTGTLAAVAHGTSDHLIERAADVMLKERRPLILVVRETPFSVIHLQNMLQLAQAGALILPANPGFYHHPQSLADLVDFVVARILDQLKIPHQLLPRWGEQA